MRAEEEKTRKGKSFKPTITEEKTETGIAVGGEKLDTTPFNLDVRVDLTKIIVFHPY